MAELDSAKVKVSDLFTKTIYKNHFYGHSYTVVLDEIDKIAIDDVKTAYNEILNNSQKTLTVVGDVDSNIVEQKLNDCLLSIPDANESSSAIKEPEYPKQEYVEIIKDDAQQAQIIQGWRVASIDHKDYPALMLLNVISSNTSPTVS